jgi:hypothetical protein
MNATGEEIYRMKATIGLAEAKARILYGLTECLQSRRDRINSAIEREDARAVEMNRRHLAAEEARFVELVECDDWDFWNLHRDIQAYVLFLNLSAAKPVKVL